MKYEVVPLKHEHLDELIYSSASGLNEFQQLQLLESEKSYFSQGSVALCLLADDRPVFAGGIVNLHWKRGEAWIIPTKFFRSHVLICMRSLRIHIPQLASKFSFTRIQATCVDGVSPKLIRHLGFVYEGTMQKFGPNGEACRMYARIMP